MAGLNITKRTGTILLLIGMVLGGLLIVSDYEAVSHLWGLYEGTKKDPAVNFFSLANLNRVCQ